MENEATQSQNTEQPISAFEWFLEHAKFPLPIVTNTSSSKMQGDPIKKGMNCPSMAFKDGGKIDRLISSLKRYFTLWDTCLAYAVGGNRHKSMAQIEQVYANLFSPHCAYKDGVKLDEWCTVHDEAGCRDVFRLGPIFAVRSVAWRLFGASIRTTFEPTAPCRKGAPPPTSEKVDAVTKVAPNSVAYLIEFKGPKVMPSVKRLLHNEPSLNIDFSNEKGVGRKVINKVMYYMHLWNADFLILTSFYEMFLFEMHEHKGVKYVSYSSVQTMKDSPNIFLVMLALVLIKSKRMPRPPVPVETAIQMHNTRKDINDEKEYEEPEDGGYANIKNEAVEQEFGAFDDLPIVPQVPEDLPEPSDIDEEMVDDDIYQDDDDDNEDYQDDEDDEDEDRGRRGHKGGKKDKGGDGRDGRDGGGGGNSGRNSRSSASRSAKKRGPPDDQDGNLRSKRSAGPGSSSAGPSKGKNAPSKVAASPLASPRPIPCPRGANTLASVTPDRRRSFIINICHFKELKDEGFPSAEFQRVRETAVHFPAFPTFDRVPRLVVVRRLGNGRTGDVYEAKLVNPVTLEGPTYAIKYVDAERRFTHEHQHCLDELHDEYVNYCLLQVGKCFDSYAHIINAFTPTCYGLFKFQGTTEEKFALITEYSGGRLRTNDLSQLRKATQHLLMESLLGIHSLGMNHGDAEGRNMVLKSLKELQETPLEHRKRHTIKFVDLCESDWHQCRGIERCEELRITWRDMFGNSDPSEFQAAMNRKYRLPFVNLEAQLTRMGLVTKQRLGKRCFIPYLPHLYQEAATDTDEEA